MSQGDIKYFITVEKKKNILFEKEINFFIIYSDIIS